MLHVNHTGDYNPRWNFKLRYFLGGGNPGITLLYKMKNMFEEKYFFEENSPKFFFLSSKKN